MANKTTTRVPDKTKNEELSEHKYASIVHAPSELSVVARARAYADMAALIEANGTVQVGQGVMYSVLASMLEYIRNNCASVPTEDFDTATTGDPVETGMNFAMLYWEALGESSPSAVS